ncbi:MAG: hypothetical protein IJZ19_10380 [Lentisphaeria bacterium]|nr:hypothetical protein [Lentisphaeria bacterium]
MENKFAKWFLDTWEETKGIITQSDAARLLGVKRQTIKTRINTGTIKEYEYIDENGKKKSYVSLDQIGKIKIRDQK